MSIRIQHLTIIDDTHPDLSPTYLVPPEDGGIDILSDETYLVDILAMVRHIMRDEPCNIIPEVRAACIHPTNRWGHNMQVEVTYSTRGYRAIYAGFRDGSGLHNVQCYMD